MRYGHFDNENREYVIDRIDLPTSWTNYLGVEDTCLVVNHTAGGYMFYKSPQYHRVTRFRGNAIPMDRPGYYVYIRDNDKNDYFSISWQPVGKPLDQAKYTCRHGMSYSVYECEYDGIKASQRMSVPLHDTVALWDVKIKNEGTTPRNLSVFSYAEFSFHFIVSDNQDFQSSLYCAGSTYQDGIIEHELHYEHNSRQFFAANFDPDGHDCLRDKFIGIYNTESNPISVQRGYCGSTEELGNNHCASLQKNLMLAPGEEVRLVYMLGEGGRDAGKKAREKYSDFANVDASYQEMRSYWQNKFDKLQIETPNEGMNTMINTWTLYQSEINIMFSRFASFIEVGGRTGLGYRDTAQDSMTIPHSNPAKCRERIMQLLQGLVSEGYGLHLFQPEWFAGEGVDPNIPIPDKKSMIHDADFACSDDALWLVSSVVEFIKETGEVNLADEVVTYADEGEGTVYEHLKRILDFSTRQVGATGICKGLRADWNDCLNLGGGESSMVSFLHYWALNKFIELAQYLGRTEDAEAYTRVAEHVKEVCNTQLWDGNWYIRGITKNGKKIGTKEDIEGKVHMECNTWAVLSGAADEEKGKLAMDAVDEYLYTPYGLLLNAPSYTVPDMDIGFVTIVYPGLKENGAIFSHPNPWAWAAECCLGRGDRAMKFYNALCPYYQNDKIEIREAEPYSYCQFVMGKDHTGYGRARHPFMTGSGGWSYFAATRYMLGVQPQFDTLKIDPCVPADWKEFKVNRQWRGADYHITVQNPEGVMKGVKQLLVDGKEADSVPAFAAGESHEVTVIMG